MLWPHLSDPLGSYCLGSIKSFQTLLAKKLSAKPDLEPPAKDINTSELWKSSDAM